MDARVHDDLTASSGGTQSVASNLTSLEDETTDEFGKLLLQNARDAQRMRDARDGKLQAFSRARPRQRSRLTLENLERSHSDKENMGPRGAFSSPPPSVSSSDRSSDPPLNVPRDWGRKARKNHDWLRRFRLGDDGQEMRSDDDAASPRKASYVGDGTPRAVDWARAATNEPIPTTEGSPSPFRFTRRAMPPDQERIDLPPRLQEWDFDEDFTANSLLVSTPGFPRNTALDEIRRRELETVEEVSVIHRSRDNSPESSRVHRSPSLSAQRRIQSSTGAADSTSIPRGAEAEIQLPKRGALGHAWSRSLSNKEAQGEEASSSSPVVVYKSEEYENSGKPRRPAPHKRTDSHDLLRRLSRAASGTPSPSRTSQQTEKESISGTKPERPDKATTDDELPVQSLPRRRDTTRKSRSPQRKNAELAGTDGDYSSTVRDKSKDRALEKAVLPAEDPVDPRTPFPDELVADEEKDPLKTPAVIGAWVNTPAAATPSRRPSSPKRARTSSKTTSPVKSPPKSGPAPNGLPTPNPSASPESRRQSPRKPTLPTSALAAIVGEARPSEANGSANREVAMGESTINSLEDIIDSSLLDAASVAAANALRASAAGSGSEENTETITLPLALTAAGARPRNAAERQRWREMEQVARMNAQLRAARTNIRDARVGLRRFEHAVLSSPETSRERSPQSDGCVVCGCRGSSSSLKPLVSGVQSLFVKPASNVSNEPTGKRGVAERLHRGRQRLTVLSILLFFLSFYMLSETILCSQFCQPRYAHSMRGFGVNPNAPRLPFVTVTLLFRPVRWVWKPAWHSVSSYGADALRGAGILAEKPAAKPRQKMSQAAWESLVEETKETDFPGLKAAVKPATTKVAEEAMGRTGTAMGWAESLQAKTSQAFREADWSKMEDDEVL